MNFLKRSLLSLWKHRVRAILLMIAFGVIGTMLFSGLSINAAASAVQSQAMRSIESKVRIVSTKGIPLTASQRKQLESMVHVTNYNYIATDLGDGTNFKTFYDDEMQEESEQMVRQSFPTADLTNECAMTNAIDS